jgi:hypothetical protein
MRHYCKCGRRYVLTVCKSIGDREPLECNADCWKAQRDSRLAAAFGSGSSLEESKAAMEKEYYPEEALDFAAQMPKFAQKVESLLAIVVLQKTTRSFTNLSSGKRAFLTMYVFEHFKLDMCTYGGKAGAGKSVTDVFWKEGCRVPDILASEVAALISRGLVSADHEATRNALFEASLVVFGIPKGSGLDEIKKLLQPFKSEYYAERKGPASHGHPAYLHFYKKQRAKEAIDFLRGAAHHYGGVELVSHRKEVGTNSDCPTDLAQPEAPKEERTANEVDADGFLVVKKRR